MSRRPAFLGHTAERPLVLGQRNGAEARLVLATGLYRGLRINDQRWVTGDDVDAAIKRGSLVEVDTPKPRRPAPARPVTPVAPEEALLEPVSASSDPQGESVAPAAQDGVEPPARAAPKPRRPATEPIVNGPL